MAERQRFGRANSLQDNFVTVEYFDKCLTAAKQAHDTAGQQRAHLNLGHAYFALENFEKALHHYRESLALAEIANDGLAMAQLSFVLGCVHHLKHDYPAAIGFHEKHLHLAQRFEDGRSQCQAYWVLSQLYEKSSQLEKGKRYYGLYATLERELDRSDTSMDAIRSATGNKLNKNLRADSITLTLSDSYLPHVTRSHSAIPGTPSEANQKSKTGFMQALTKRSMVLLPKQTAPCADSEQLVELIDRVQNTRLNDQRCVMKKSGTGQSDTREPRSGAHLEDVLNTIDRLQKTRLNDQRTTLRKSPHHHHHPHPQQHSSLSDQFFDQLSKCQDSRLDDQRAALLPLRPATIRAMSATSSIASRINVSLDEPAAKTLPDEEFLSVYRRLQARPQQPSRLHASPLKRIRVNT